MQRQRNGVEAINDRAKASKPLVSIIYILQLGVTDIA